MNIIILDSFISCKQSDIYVSFAHYGVHFFKDLTLQSDSQHRTCQFDEAFDKCINYCVSWKKIFVFFRKGSPLMQNKLPNFFFKRNMQQGLKNVIRSYCWCWYWCSNHQTKCKQNIVGVAVTDLISISIHYQHHYCWCWFFFWRQDRWFLTWKTSKTEWSTVLLDCVLI